MLIFYRKHHKVHLLNYYAVFPSIIFVLATSWISDLDIYANFGLLLPGLLVGFIDLHNEIEEDVTTHQKLAKDIEKFLIRSEFEIKRYQPGYYNFYLFDEITKEKFVMHDADKYNEE